MHFAINPATNTNFKHIDVRHQFLLKRVANGEFVVAYMSSDPQHEDFLTKPLHRDFFYKHRRLR